MATSAMHHNDVVVVSRNRNWLDSLDSRIQTIQFDLGNPGKDPYKTLGYPDLMLHLAWSGLPQYHSPHHVETELPAQYNFLESMVNAGLRNLMVTGTCLEYGMKSGLVSEAMDTEPTNPYGIAKDTLRRKLETLKSSTPFNLTWTRLFYMYGDGQGENSLYPLLKQAVLDGEKVFNMSGGEQLRDYLHVSEVARLLLLLGTNSEDNGVVNVCSGKPISIRTLVERWIEEEALNIAMNLGHYPYPDYEPMAFWGNRRRLDQILNGKTSEIEDESK